MRRVWKVRQAPKSDRLLGRNDITAYFVLMATRLLAMHRVLKPTGSRFGERPCAKRATPPSTSEQVKRELHTRAAARDAPGTLRMCESAKLAPQLAAILPLPAGEGRGEGERCRSVELTLAPTAPSHPARN